ncbi:MAG: CusA/CzcA family heavy metal efflux RND transporter [Planctomycetes bacterium]|nr:CusA/CzcA family heavy metal efflux RND transporter [Planctomycetota bacterium]
MLDRIISWSLSHRAAVIALTLLVAVLGALSLRSLPIDAFPDTTPVQVQVNTVAPALGPAEIESQVTAAVERAIGGLPGLLEMRSISKFGLSQVTVVFRDGMDVYRARQFVAERLQTVELPPELGRPEMGPVATGLGEIYHYVVSGKGRTLEELTTIHDGGIRPRLATVPGVAEVNTWGGERRQYHVLVDPVRLVERGMTIDDVTRALRENNANVGGGVISRAGEMHLVHGVGLTTSVAEISNVVITARSGVPVRIRDVADVAIGHEIRRGAVTIDGKGEVVLGLAFLLMGENSHEVTTALEARMEEIRPTLPAGVEVHTVHERTHLVADVIATVERNLLEGALLVVAVLFVFLGNLRAGLIVAAAIPLSMLFAANAMLRFGIAGSLMSLGAIDFGLIVDSSVIVVENSVRRLAGAGADRPVTDVVREASSEVRRPTMFGELIIAVVYLPVLALEGIEGKMFRPMALTVLFALAGSMVLSLTLMPVLASLLLRRGTGHGDNVLVRAAKGLYGRTVRLAIRFRAAVIVVAVALLASGAWVASHLGAEFVPRLAEMSLVINTVRAAGVSLDESVRYGSRIETLLRERFPDEIETVWTRTGTAEVATDPMGIEVSDTFITLRHREKWKRATTQTELVDAMRSEIQGLPGMRASFTQPIEMRINEMVAGIRADVGVKVFGDDLEILKRVAGDVDRILRGVPGAADVTTEQVVGQPVLEVRVDQERIARHGIAAARVLEVVEAVGGIHAGEIREGQRRFDLVVLLPERFREDPDALRTIVVPAPNGERIPLTDLAAVRETEGPSTITREWGRRRIVVQTNVQGRDVAGFVADVRRAVTAGGVVPDGYHVEFGGQFEHLERARARLTLVVPLALLLILGLLYASTGSLRDTLIISTGAPFAAFGGILALWLRDMPFTISAGVGFVAVSGVSMLSGLVMVSTIRQIAATGVPIDRAIEEGALTRVRPILMTALVASLGFVPMMVSTGVGAEVQRPLATVVVGGIVADNLLSLLVLPVVPALVAVFRPRAVVARRD